jgi:dsDNA-binding SOS-regulon protein
VSGCEEVKLMAYLRGDYYIWHDESAVHFWSRDGYDAWDMSGWACDEDASAEGVRRDGFEEASGTSVPQEIADAYVMMRLVELIEEGLIDSAIEKAAVVGSYQSLAVARNADRLRAALKSLKLAAPIRPWGVQTRPHLHTETPDA